MQVERNGKLTYLTFEMEWPGARYSRVRTPAAFHTW